MKLIVVGAIAVAATVHVANAETCAEIGNDLDRLACYDKESRRAPKTSTATLDNWIVTTSASKLTDDKTVTLIATSDEEITCRWNQNHKIRVVVRCLEKTTSLYFDTGCHMASSNYSNYGDIEYRVDNEKARKVSGDASTDNRALGLWSGAKSIPVVKQMLDKSRLTVRMMPYGESPFTATFNISGLAEAIKPLRKECGW